MRVELIYRPGCDMYSAIHKILEDVIADEQLPIPVEVVEDHAHQNSPKICIDGKLVLKVHADHTFDHLREIVCQKWAEITRLKRLH